MINIYQLYYILSDRNIGINVKGMYVPSALFIMIYIVCIIINSTILLIEFKEINKTKKIILITLNTLNIVIASSGLIAIISILSIVVLLLKDRKNEKDEKINIIKYIKYIVCGLLLGLTIGAIFAKTTIINPLKPFIEGIVIGISIALMLSVVIESKRD